MTELEEAIKDSKVEYNIIKDFDIIKCLSKFFNLEKMKGKVYPRYFEFGRIELEHKVYFEELIYDDVTVTRDEFLLNLKYDKNVYIFSEDVKEIFSLNYKNLLKVIFNELPNMTIYITNNNLDFMIIYTEENTMPVYGYIPNKLE